MALAFWASRGVFCKSASLEIKIEIIYSYYRSIPVDTQFWGIVHLFGGWYPSGFKTTIKYWWEYVKKVRWVPGYWEQYVKYYARDSDIEDINWNKYRYGL